MLTHFAHVDANAYARQVALRGMRFLQAESKRDSGARRLEGYEGTISRPVNDSAVRLRYELSNLFPVPTNQHFYWLIPSLPFQRGRICKVGED
jgi:hypothetical protein